jgi:hypothetical protein
MSMTKVHRTPGNAVAAARVHRALPALAGAAQTEQRQSATLAKPVAEWRTTEPDQDEIPERRNEEIEEFRRCEPELENNWNTS